MTIEGRLLSSTAVVSVFRAKMSSLPELQNFAAVAYVVMEN